MKKIKVFLTAAVVTAVSVIPVLADITGNTTITTTTTTITEIEYPIGDIDNQITLFDSQITLKLALHIINNPQQKSDCLDMFLTAMDEKIFHLEDYSDTNFLALYSYSPEITNEQLTSLAQYYDGIKVCSSSGLHRQGLHKNEINLSSIDNQADRHYSNTKLTYVI